MPVRNTAEPNGDSTGQSPLAGDIRVVIAYNDIVAGTRAMGVLAKLAGRLGDKLEFLSIPWSFNLLDDVDWRAVAASDAVNADILILAVSSSGAMPSSVERWTRNVIERKKGTTAAVIALFDRASTPDIGMIKRWVQQAGLSFFTPAQTAKPEETVARLDERAERVTSVLQHILEDQGVGQETRSNE